MQTTPTSARRAPTSAALTRAVLAVTATLALVGADCSGDDAPGPGAAAGRTTTTTSEATVIGSDGEQSGDERAEGPVADLSEELTGGGGPFIGSATGLEVPDGYVEVELVAAGTAIDYTAEGDLAADGVWSFAPDSSADYRTRVLVRRPEDPAAASGTVIVEWLNVSGGLDANPDYANLEAEIVRRGHTWVGVSAQLIGVEGGPVLVAPSGVEDIVGLGLRALDPDRYGTLDHPGDGYAFDIFTQVGRAVARGGEPLGGIEPDVVLAAGQSQSAIALTTYHNGVQPLTGTFDGFLIHSRAFATLPLVPPGEYADLTAAMVTTPEAVHLRTDLHVPVLVLQAEGDVVGILNSAAARQDDNDGLRLWEVAGTAHADTYLLGEIADTLGCGMPVNDGPMHLVAKAALASLDTWVRTGDAPPEAPRLDLTDDAVPAIARDGDGIALGGIRTPPVDVPAVVLSGAPAPDADLLCLLMGSTAPLADTRLAERYASRADYEAEYAAAVDEAIAAGFVLAADRDDLMGFARPDALPG